MPLVVAFVLALLLVAILYARRAKVPATATATGALPPALEAWVTETLAHELRHVRGLARDQAFERVVSTLRGDPDPDVVSAVAEAVKKVELEYTKLPHEASTELALVVCYEDGRERRVTRRLAADELPADVREALTTSAVTRVYRAWEFGWDRAR